MANESKYKYLPATGKERLFCLLLVVVTLAVYYPVKDYDFVNYDDPMYVIDNYAIRSGLTWDTVIWSFTGGTEVTNYWAPMTWLSIAFDYHLYGLNAGGYHLTNLILHLANSLLLFFVFLRMAGKFWQSAFIAALFALHPLHVESVAWITERKDVLSTFFWFLTMYVYASYVNHPRPGWYIALLTSFTLGLMAKPMLVTLPFVLLLIDYWPLERIKTGKPSEPLSVECGRNSYRSLVYLVVEKIPFFVITVIFSAVTYVFQNEGNALPSLEKITFPTRMENVIISYATYLWQMFWPFDLAVLYPYPQKISAWAAFSAFALLVAVSVLAFRQRRRFPYFIVGWLWYIGTLVPVIGFVVIGSHVRADRYTYVSYVGLFVMLAWGGGSLVRKFPRYRRYLVLFFLSFVLFLAIISRSQLTVWKNSINLFDHCLEVTTANYVAENNLGLALKEKGLVSEAIVHYSNALKINPTFEMAHLNLGVALAEQGKIKAAEKHYLKALELKPDLVAAYCNIGNIRFRSGRIDEAIVYYRQALGIDPNYIEALNGLGGAWVRKGNLDQAERLFRKALSLKPDDRTVLNNLNNILKYKKNKASAAKSLSRAPTNADRLMEPKP